MRSRSWLVALAVSLGLYAVGAATTQAPRPAPAEVPDRARLLGLQREAVSLLKQAARADALIDQVRRALLDASQRLETLGAEPDPRVAADAREALRLAPALRAELRRAAGELVTLAATQAQVADTGPFLALLERVRAQLEGEIALGLSFQGNYSQTQAKEPIYGGHASAMGPPPANAPSPDDVAATSPVAFEEAVRLSTRSFGGGPRRTTSWNRAAVGSLSSTMTATGVSISMS